MIKQDIKESTVNGYNITRGIKDEYTPRNKREFSSSSQFIKL